GHVVGVEIDDLLVDQERDRVGDADALERRDQPLDERERTDRELLLAAAQIELRAEQRPHPLDRSLPAVGLDTRQIDDDSRLQHQRFSFCSTVERSAASSFSSWRILPTVTGSLPRDGFASVSAAMVSTRFLSSDALSWISLACGSPGSSSHASTRSA